MAVAIPDLGEGIAWLVRGQSKVRTLSVALTSGSTVTVSSGTYTLYDSAGAVVSTGAVTGATGSASRTVDLTAYVGDIGAGFYELWTLTLASSHTMLPVRISAAVGLYDLHQPVGLAAVLRRHPSLSQAPTDGWSPVITEAWYAIRRLLAADTRVTTTVLHNPDVLYEPSLLRALEYIFRQSGTFSGGFYEEQALSYQLQADAAWSRLDLEYDTDGDGTGPEIDHERPRPEPVFPPNPPAAQRRG